MTDQAQKYAAFITPEGTFLQKRMPFKNALFEFCRLMRKIFTGLKNVVT